MRLSEKKDLKILFSSENSCGEKSEMSAFCALLSKFTYWAEWKCDRGWIYQWQHFQCDII